MTMPLLILGQSWPYYRHSESISVYLLAKEHYSALKLLCPISHKNLKLTYRENTALDMVGDGEMRLTSWR